MKNKNVWTISSVVLFFSGLFLSLTINGYIRDFDSHHLLILLPVVLPILGLLFGVYAIAKTERYKKILPALFVLANLGLCILIFFVYAFSYWQF